MGDQSRSTYFRALFESALQEYEKNTGIALAQHPLAVQIRSCRSIESITTLLQGASSDFGGNDRIINSIKSTISILSALSATTALDWTISLVRQDLLIAHSTSLTIIEDVLT